MPRQTQDDVVARARRKLESIQHLIYKLKAIRALYVTAHNSSVDGQKIYSEFYHAIGDLIEGRRVEELQLHNIKREEFLREFKDE
jgi:hypothetical protein